MKKSEHTKQTYREKGSWCPHITSTIFVRILQTNNGEKEGEICSARIKINIACLCWGWDGCLQFIVQYVIASSSRKKVVGDKGSSRGGRMGVKDWYARKVMICEPSIAKALICDKRKANCQQTLAKTIMYDCHQPRGFMLQSV